MKINWDAVKYRICSLIPTEIRNKIAEVVANLLPRRVVGWVMFRACKDFDFNKHITLWAAVSKYKNYAQTKRGVSK